MNSLRLLIEVFLVMLSLFSCTPVINYMSFFPTKDNSDYSNEVDFKEIFINSANKVKLQSLYFESAGSSKIVIYFHGNGGNISQCVPSLRKLHSLGVNVVGVSYRGYGKSTGKPQEKGIYEDGNSVFRYVCSELKFQTNNVYLYGRSIGTTVAVNTAKNRDIGGLILIAPLTDAKEYIRFHGLGFLKFLAGNAFDTMSKLGQIRCKTVVIHGTADDVLPYEMGRKVYDNLTCPKELVTIEGGSHDDLNFKDPVKFWGAIKQILE